jgi:hypothetical protein
MDNIQINANLCKKISANKENTPLERALADKCLDLYRIVAERSTEKRWAEDCVFAIFSQIKHTYGYKFDEKRTRCREATMQGKLRKLREELDKLKVEG